MSGPLSRLPRPRLPRPRLPLPGRRGGDAGTTDVQEERPTELERVVAWFDERTGAAHYAAGAVRKVFPDHWSFLLGEAALFCFVILVLTGTFLTFFYVPDTAITTYDGPYGPLRGAEVSRAFASVMELSFEVRSGLIMRQIHHWTALVFVAVIALHATRVFFTGAFRRPRELNWIIGIGLLLLAFAEGLTGYSLPDDLLSGTGVRITYSTALAIPFLGPSIAFLIFGGEFPTEALISRFFVFHIFLLPGLYIGGIGVHILLTWLQKHTQFRGHGATEENVVGPPFWPVQVFRSLGLFFLVAALMAGLGGLIEINPVWSYGPFVPYAVTVPAQPDWYVGWLEGALRLGPSFEPTILGVTIPTPFFPGIFLPGLLFTILALWPWLERRASGDTRPHNLLDWPWEAPVRTSLGAAILTIFLVQTVAGGNDVLALFLNTQVEWLTLAFQVLVLVLPVVVGLVTYALCRERLRRSADDVSRPSGVQLRRRSDGGWEEIG
jgi:ubiquinol-cytochrome c reductase cytochrome b subunit